MSASSSPPPLGEVPPLNCSRGPCRSRRSPIEFPDREAFGTEVRSLEMGDASFPVSPGYERLLGIPTEKAAYSVTGQNRFWRLQT